MKKNRKRIIIIQNSWNYDDPPNGILAKKSPYLKKEAKKIPYPMDGQKSGLFVIFFFR